MNLFALFPTFIALVLAVILGAHKGRAPFLRFIRQDLPLYMDFVSFTLRRRRHLNHTRTRHDSRQTRRKHARELAKLLTY